MNAIIMEIAEFIRDAEATALNCAWCKFYSGEEFIGEADVRYALCALLEELRQIDLNLGGADFHPVDISKITKVECYVG